MATIAESQNPRRVPKRLIAAGIIILILVVGAVLVATNVQTLFNAGDSALNFIFNPESRVNPNEIVQCRSESGCSTIQAIIFSLIFFIIVLTGFAYTTLLERKFIAFFQQRSGPNRVGPNGLLQPAADGVKLIFKEDIIPAGVDLPVYLIAPILKTVPNIILLAVIPFGPDLIMPWFDGRWYQVPLGLADPNVGVLWLLAITSIGTYGVVLAGWASNNKYAMLGGLRATAQMLSYELSLGLTMAVPVIIAGTMSIGDIIRQQVYFHEWFIFQNPLAFGILFIALLAEINRAPFDLPEAEQELTAGFMTEYSGMKFAMFMMAEYLGMIGISVVISSLYLGGYNDGFGLVNALPILGPLVMIGKVVLFLILLIWIRSTLPRIRYDRLMSFGWKVLLPLAITAVMWTTIALLIIDSTGSDWTMYWIVAFFLLGIMLIGGVAAFGWKSLVPLGLVTAVWVLISSAVISSSPSSILVYALLSTLFLFVIVVGGYFLLKRNNVISTAPNDTYEDDPIITGESRGFGAIALQVLGALIAIPFALYKFTLSALDGLAQFAPENKNANNDEQPNA